jgi:hypothetical protein
MLPKSLRPLFPYLKKYRNSFIVGMICVFCNNGFDPVPRCWRAIDDLPWVNQQKL